MLSKHPFWTRSFLQARHHVDAGVPLQEYGSVRRRGAALPNLRGRYAEGLSQVLNRSVQRRYNRGFQ
jgi:hypothetical protein